MMTIDKAKAFAAVAAGIAALAASAASATGYTLPAMIAGGIFIIAGIGLAISSGGNTNAN